MKISALHFVTFQSQKSVAKRGYTVGHFYFNWREMTFLSVIDSTNWWDHELISQKWSCYSCAVILPIRYEIVIGISRHRYPSYEDQSSVSIKKLFHHSTAMALKNHTWPIIMINNSYSRVSLPWTYSKRDTQKRVDNSKRGWWWFFCGQRWVFTCDLKYWEN